MLIYDQYFVVINEAFSGSTITIESRYVGLSRGIKIGPNLVNAPVKQSSTYQDFYQK